MTLHGYEDSGVAPTVEFPTCYRIAIFCGIHILSNFLDNPIFLPCEFSIASHGMPVTHSDEVTIFPTPAIDEDCASSIRVEALDRGEMEYRIFDASCQA